MKQTKQFLRPLLMAIVMLVGMLVPQGAWAEEYPVITGGTHTIDIAAYRDGYTEFSNYTTIFKYVAPNGGTLTVYTEGEGDTASALFDEDKTTLAYDDDSGNSGNFKFSYKVVKDHTYYIGVCSSEDFTNYTLVIDESDLCDHEIVNHVCTICGKHQSRIVSVPAGVTVTDDDGNPITSEDYIWEGRTVNISVNASEVTAPIYIGLDATTAEGSSLNIRRNNSFVMPGSDVTLNYMAIPSEPLCFEALEADAKIGFSSIVSDYILYYLTDKENWTSFNYNDTHYLPTLANAGDKIYLIGNVTSSSAWSYTQVKIENANVAASGKLSSILGGATTIYDFGCYKMFYYNGNLISAPDMSDITEIGECGCDEMFRGCSALTTAPAMSSLTAIGVLGCDFMFYDCSALTTAPAMSSLTAIGYLGCDGMFSHCPQLTGFELNTVPYVGNYAFNNFGTGNITLKLSDDSYVYVGENPGFPTVTSVTAPCTLNLTGSVVENHANLVHTNGERIVDAAVAPTCTTTGLTEGSHCSLCNMPFVAQVEIEALGHDYHVQQDENEKPVFVWSEGYTTATLQVVCSHDAEHTAGVEVTLGEGITSEDTTPATCTTAGVRTYTAKATYEGVEYTGTKEVEIPAGHSFVDGVCELCHGTAVAEVKIGETTTGYTDIQEAFDAAMAATGEVTVKLLADVTLTEGVNNLARGEEANRYDVALTLDLNGHSVTGNYNQAVIYVTSITLNITDEGKTGSINNCRLLVFKSDIYVAEGVTLRAEQWDWDLVNLAEDCSLVNDGNLYGNVVYCSGTTFTNCGSVVSAQYMGGNFENWGSFIPIWYWVYNDVDEVMSYVSVSVNGTIYSSVEGAFEVSSEVTKAPTCTEKGERTYSATVTYEDKDFSDTYTAEIGIDPNAHDFTSKTLTDEPDEDSHLYAYVCDREGCEGHSDYNVVKGNGEGNNIELIATTDSETGITTYSAESVIIEDGKPFYSPVEFTTRDVDMGRQFTQSIGDAVVPATIMLPFRMYAGEVSTVNPQGVRTGTKFYSFTSLDYNSDNDRWEANMDIVIDDLEAYTPYMVVLTDGEEIPFGNAPVTFTQTPAEMNNITSSDGEWSFVATNEAKVWTAADFGHGEAYYGFAAGNETTPEGKFVKVGTGASIDPLRAYIMKNVQTRGSASNAPSRALTASQLPSTIGVRLNETYATGIGTLNTETGEFTFDGWYDLQGRRISEPVKNGISIKNDKKILVK